jgi:hypothetical protein
MSGKVMINDVQTRFLRKFCDAMMKGELNKSYVEMADFLIRKMNFEITDIPHEDSKLRQLYIKSIFQYKCNVWGIESLGKGKISKVIDEYLKKKT